MVVPSALTSPPRAWPDSTLPIAASNCQGRLQPGFDSARVCSARLYASRTVAGMPASAGLLAGRPMEVPGLSGAFSGGRSVWYEESPLTAVSSFGCAVVSAAWSPPAGGGMVPGPPEAESAAMAAAATAVVVTPLRSLRPNRAAIRMVPPRIRMFALPARGLRRPYVNYWP